MALNILNSVYVGQIHVKGSKNQGHFYEVVAMKLYICISTLRGEQLKAHFKYIHIFIHTSYKLPFPSINIHRPD